MEAYRNETKISGKKSKELYEMFNRVLSESTHGTNMEVKIEMLLKNEEAFNHPILKNRLDELKKNAIQYTVHKQRSGITKTTSIVDNFLKIAKRKLRQVMSFRDPKWAAIMFKAMANVRNFVPFMTGAKNAHKSPFMLTGGQDFGLSWMQ
ncbi:MAG: hypothetical protein OMM_15001, partial [Candidatus Magnetoglobus multicellularis str. Araruama]